MKIKITESQLKRLIKKQIIREAWYDDIIDKVKNTISTPIQKIKDIFKDISGGKIDFDNDEKETELSKSEIENIKKDFEKELGVLKDKKEPTTTGNVELVGDFNNEQEKNIKYLIQFMEEKGIKNPYTQIGILSVISKETNFIPKSEGGAIGYCKTSNDRIRKLFGKRVPSSDAELNSLKCNNEKFFNRIYAKTVGNQGGGDGWRYRGRGFNQLTGIKNYEKYGNMIGMGNKLVENPDLVNDPEIAARIAIAFFTKGKSPSTFPNFTNKEDAAIYFADINAGGGPSKHRSKALEGAKKFDVKN